MTINSDNLVARNQSRLLCRRAGTYLLDLNRALRVLHEDTGLAQVVVQGVYSSRQMNRSLKSGAIAFDSDGDGLVCIVSDKIVKFLIVGMRHIIERSDDVAGL